jgi:sugar phosphate isomerase/epimerase
MNDPRFSVSECTTFPLSFADDLKAYREGGADGVGIWEFKLKAGNDAENLARLRDSGLAASICVPDVPCIYPDSYFTEPRDPVERTRALCAAIRRLAPFRPDTVLVSTGAPIDDVAEMRGVTVRGLREVAKVAAGEGLRIGVEPYRVTSGAMVNTLPDAVELADEIGGSNVGVIVDLWHLWNEPGFCQHLRQYGQQVFGIQISDWRQPTRSWADRILPGDGVIDLTSILKAAEDGGYAGWYDLEIFSDDGRFGERFPDSISLLDPVDVTRCALQQFQKAWASR